MLGTEAETVNKWWESGGEEQRSFEVHSSLPIPLHGCGKKPQHRKLVALASLSQGAPAALKQEALGRGLTAFRPWTSAFYAESRTAVCLWTATSWAEQAIQLRLYKGQRGAGRLESTFNAGWSEGHLLHMSLMVRNTVSQPTFYHIHLIY